MFIFSIKIHKNISVFVWNFTSFFHLLDWMVSTVAQWVLKRWKYESINRLWGIVQQFSPKVFLNLSRKSSKIPIQKSHCAQYNRQINSVKKAGKNKLKISIYFSCFSMQIWIKKSPFEQQSFNIWIKISFDTAFTLMFRKWKSLLYLNLDGEFTLRNMQIFSFFIWLASFLDHVWNRN
jgi:hypothetical protein